MPQVTVEGLGTFEVPTGKRLVNALVDEVGADQLHACGGQARCTTCRVKFIDGEPQQISAAEKERLEARQITEPGVRLSCQILCNDNMSIELLSRLEGSGRADQGTRCADNIQPEPVVWLDR